MARQSQMVQPSVPSSTSSRPYYVNPGPAPQSFMGIGRLINIRYENVEIDQDQEGQMDDEDDGNLGAEWTEDELRMLLIRIKTYMHVRDTFDLEGQGQGMETGDEAGRLEQERVDEIIRLAGRVRKGKGKGKERQEIEIGGPSVELGPGLAIEYKSRTNNNNNNTSLDSMEIRGIWRCRCVGHVHLHGRELTPEAAIARLEEVQAMIRGQSKVPAGQQLHNQTIYALENWRDVEEECDFDYQEAIVDDLAIYVWPRSTGACTR